MNERSTQQDAQRSAGADPGLLVDPAWLEAHLDDPQVRILDCTTYMTPQPVGPSTIESGRPDWERAHIPGAAHVDMVADLSDPQGRFPYSLPTDEQVAALLSRLGIGNEHRVVVYAARQPMVATRVWWVLTVLGHDRVSILDGGWERWQREGRPVTDRQPSHPPAVFRPARRTSMVADAETVARAIADGSAHVVNALAPEQFHGTGGAHYGRPGRIPGSISLPARHLVDYETQDWRTFEEIARRATEAGLDDPDRSVITYCGGGIAATVAFFALYRLGFRNLALYDNSLLEWSADPARPMERTEGTDR